VQDEVRAPGKVSDGGPAAKKARLGAVERALFGLAGALLLVGFFLPWFLAGELLSMSGLGLVFAGGEVVGMLTGTSRVLLVFVPVQGAILLAGAIDDHGLTRWAAVGGSGLLLLFGLYLLVRLFISSTGIGMWIVVFAALLALSIGLVGVGGRASAKAADPR
jgi:hypothetical protein